MEYREKLKKIKAFAFDVDGVYSSFMITLPGGEMLRTMDSKDGLITRLALDQLVQAQLCLYKRCYSPTSVSLDRK